MKMSTLLVRGMLVGLLAGCVAFGLAKLLGEPQVNKAIAFESHLAETHHEHEGKDPVSRPVQASYGLGTGAIAAGVAFGGLFAIVFALGFGRLGTTTARGTALLLAGLAFVAVYLVPNLKYPANPPAIGQPDTIGHRTNLYLGLIVLSVIAMGLAAVGRKLLVPQLGPWNATVVAGLGYLALVVIAYVVAPGINEVPQAALPGVVKAVTDGGVTFPPTVLWRFRIASMAIQLGLWATIGLGFGVLTERRLAGPTVPG